MSPGFAISRNAHNSANFSIKRTAETMSFMNLTRKERYWKERRGYDLDCNH